jgi:predicted SprT family Zn-dependent metalloprotease
MDRLPTPIATSLTSTIQMLNITLVVSKPRKTKLGDWRFSNNMHKITINNDLSPQQFFMTLVHEIAHATTWNKYRGSVKPHGVQWKSEFRNLMLPLLKGYFPVSIEDALREHMKNPSACSGHSTTLVRAFNPNSTTVEDYPMDRVFKYKGVEYKKINKRRTRWSCVNLSNGKPYLFPSSFVL